MNISLETIDQASALLTLNIEEADYQTSVKDELKKMSQKAQVPGFRKGKVPTAMLAKLYGGEVKAKQINDLVTKHLFDYLKENNINILGEPLPSTKQPTQDIETEKDFTFLFDLAIAPQIDFKLSSDTELPYYKIEVAEDMINSQLEDYARRAGTSEERQAYVEGAIVRGILGQLDAEGNTLEGGLVVEKASVMPKYFKKGAEVFDNAKVNDVITFSPWEVYEGSETEVTALLKVKKEDINAYQGNFSFQIESISEFVPAPINQALFDQIYGEGVVTSEEDFKQKITAEIAERFTGDSDYKLLLDARTYAENAVGKLTLADDILKRFMLLSNEDKGEAFVEEGYEDSIKELTWQLIKNELIKQYEVKVEQADILETAKEATRFQFIQYGMGNLPEDLIEQYAKQMLSDKQQYERLVQRAIDTKVTAAIKANVKLDEKSISLDDFKKMFE